MNTHLYFHLFHYYYLTDNKEKQFDLNIVKKIPLNDSNIMSKENKCVDKSTPNKENDKSESFKSLYSSPIASQENQSDEDFYFSTQKYQLRNTPTRVLTENGVKVYKEPRGSIRNSSRKIKKSQKLTPKLKLNLENEENIVLDGILDVTFLLYLIYLFFSFFIIFSEPNRILFNEEKEKLEKENLSKIPIAQNLKKPPVISNKNTNVSVVKTVKIVEPVETDEKAKLDETFSLGKDDLCDKAPKKVDKENAKRKSVRFSSQGCSQQVFKRLSMSVPTPKTNFKTMAELLIDFEKKTRIYSPPANKPKINWKVTKPVAPHLTAITRNREVRVSSFDEELKKIKSYTFKATPFNRKLFDSKLYQGMTRVYPKPTTKPKGHVFQSDLRIKSRQSKLFKPSEC